MKIIDFKNTFSYKLIYVFTIYDRLHQGILKIGETTLNTDKEINELQDNCEELNNAAKKRIRNYTNTIGVMEHLLYTTLAMTDKKGTFKDKDVHNVLVNSGIKKHDFKNEKSPEEWFETDLTTVKNAIKAVKQGKKALTPNDISHSHQLIQFRPEQSEAIRKTVKHFKTENRMLWNAKMRFGKTLSALEVIRQSGFSKTIILTHRPVVNEGWFEDFKKIFHGSDQYLYGSKNGTSIESLLESGKKIIYFTSIQDLRESSPVGGKFDKNNIVFNMNWDFVVIDEAHEGTQTSLGTKVLNEIIKEDSKYITKVLFLSGTPFNLLNNFEEKEIYTWDYIMEQQAKLDWEKNHRLETNPYLDLPRLNIFTYNLDKMFPGYIDIADTAFNFREFFRVWTGDISKDGKGMPADCSIGDFVHKEDVRKFLDLMCWKSETSNYPFSKEEYIDNFRHSFWIVPGIREARALTSMLRQHPNYQMFEIVNVAGTGDNNGYEALEAVEKAIGSNPNETYTITISCGRLTTGVTVKAWTAVFYLAGSYSTSATNYLQTIFRVQSPANYDGKIKTDCYVFDFAPDRTLKMIAQAGDLSIKAGAIGSKEKMREFLNYCPVIAVSESTMERYDVSTMLQQLKKAYAERVVNNGFDDSKIYNDELIKLNPQALEILKELEGIIGKTKQSKKITSIDINNQGFTEEEVNKIEDALIVKSSERTEEQKRLLEEKKEKIKQKNNAISVLRGISIRIPLLIYGSDLQDGEVITPENFTSLIDDLSWEEFMPKGVTKKMFGEISKYYDKEIFIEAGRRIRSRAKYADTLLPIERAKNLAELFSTFKNPDKETVLTPWKTVNMHMGDTLGGYNFFDETYIDTLQDLRLINNGEVTSDTLLNTNTHILEVNSKTGLYPLYAAISIFKQRCLNTDSKKLNEEYMKILWKQTVQDNIFVVCKTLMAKKITKRTLIGYGNNKVNIIDIPNMIELFKDNSQYIIELINNPKNWGREGWNMKFDAIIGNPPYQNSTGGGQSQGTPLYDKFVLTAMKLKPNYISMIMPSRWFSGGFASLDKFREEFTKGNHIMRLCDFPSALDCFSNVEIKGGVCYFLYNIKYNGKCNFRTYQKHELVSEADRYLIEKGCKTIIRDNNAISILRKITSKKYKSFASIISALWPYTMASSFNSFSHSKKDKDDYIAYVLKDKGWVSKNEIKKNFIIANKWKIFIPRNVGKGDKKTDIIKPILGEPNSVCSGTYIICGPFDTEKEAKNVIKYINTKFFHFLLSLKKVSQENTNKCYEFIPKLDFNEEYNDEKLFKLFDLSKKEIDYINLSVRKEIGQKNT